MPISRRDLLRTGGCAALVAVYVGGPRRASAVTAAPTTFDYYISTSGSNSNPGTLASPWAITALNSPTLRALYAGKSIGIIAGVYNVYSLVQAANPTAPALCIQGGTSKSPTYIAACNSAGVYTARVAQISADSSGRLNGGSYPTSQAGIIGQGMSGGTSTQTVSGFVTIDGLYVTRGYMFAITLWGASQGTGSLGTVYGNTVQNCEVYDIAGIENNNMNGINLWGQNGALISNNLVHSVIPTSGNVALWDCSGISGQLNLNNIYQYNTIYNCNAGIYDKNQYSGGHTYRYNYIESTGTYANTCIQDGAGGNAGTTMTAHHNIMVCSNGQGQGLWLGIDAEISPVCNYNVYNNTFYMTASSSSGMICFGTTGPGATIHFYNNLVVMNGTAKYAGLIALGQKSALTLSDYNCLYQTGATSSTPIWGITAGATQAATTYSLTNWQSTVGLDTHSRVADPSFVAAGTVFGTGSRPGNVAGYQLPTASACYQTGRVGGTSSGAPCNIGAWDGTVTQIGCNFTSGSTGTAPGPLPVAPQLTVT
jgi:hypothetical protein